jgi:hypothetical protein
MGRLDPSRLLWEAKALEQRLQFELQESLPYLTAAHKLLARISSSIMTLQLRQKQYFGAVQANGDGAMLSRVRSTLFATAKEAIDLIIRLGQAGLLPFYTDLLSISFSKPGVFVSLVSMSWRRRARRAYSDLTYRLGRRKDPYSIHDQRLA